MQLCKFSLIIFLLFYRSVSFGLFEGRDCLKSQFNIQVSHKGPPMGFLLNKLKIEKRNCVLIVEKEKFRLIRSKWEFDVCRYPIHIKEGAGAIKVHKKLRKSCDFSSENKDKFCNSLKDLKNAISDYGLIFAKGEKEDLLSDHGKVYCSFLLINFYFDEEKIFSFNDDLKTTQYFTKGVEIKTENESENTDEVSIEDTSIIEDEKAPVIKLDVKKLEEKSQDSTVDNKPETKAKENAETF